MNHQWTTRALGALGIAALAAGAASPARAQQATAGPKWQGWIGCWTPSAVEAGAFSSADSGLLVCITPASAESVNITTIEGGKVVSRQTLEASGREQPFERTNCKGVQKASWSSDQRRLFLTSAATCDGLRTATSAILAITPSGEWLDVRGVTSAGAGNVRVARYRDAGFPGSLPAEIADALRSGRGLASADARVVTGSAIRTSDVVEASRAADASVVSAWIFELGQRFAVDAPALLQLSKAGVPGSVTDALVATSYPKAFQVARADARRRELEERPNARRVTAFVDESYGAYGGAPIYGYGPYGYAPLGYSPYGYGTYGYGRSPLGGTYGGYYTPPIVIIRGNDTPAPHGQVVKGHGYTQSGYTPPPPSSTTAAPRSSEGSSSAATTPSSSSSGSSSSGSSSSSGRTAQPRP